MNALLAKCQKRNWTNEKVFSFLLSFFNSTNCRMCPLLRYCIYNNLLLVGVLCNFSELNIVYQRNGDGEAKSPARRAGVCEAVLHTLKQGTRLSSQVSVYRVHLTMTKSELLLSCLKWCWLKWKYMYIPFRFYGRNSSYVHGGLDPNGKLAEAVYGQAVCVVFCFFSSGNGIAL